MEIWTVNFLWLEREDDRTKVRSVVEVFRDELEARRYADKVRNKRPECKVYIKGQII